MKKKLSKKQQQAYNFLVKYREEKGYTASLKELANELGIKETSAHQHLNYLEWKGYISRPRHGIIVPIIK